MDKASGNQGGTSEQERRARLDKALRENLKKRKQQHRARSQTDKSGKSINTESTSQLIRDDGTK